MSQRAQPMAIETRLAQVANHGCIRCVKPRCCEPGDADHNGQTLVVLFNADAAWDGGELGCCAGPERIHRVFAEIAKI